MSYLNEILQFNKEFVNNKEYEKYKTTKFPNKKIAIVSCMDTRLTELLPAALNIKNGDIKIIKTAGATITHPFGSVMRSLLVAIYELGVEEIMIVAHLDCGIQCLDSKEIIKKMLSKGIDENSIGMIDYCGINLSKWLEGFSDVNTSVRETVNLVKIHPLVPKNISVHGFVMNPDTGELKEVN